MKSTNTETRNPDWKKSQIAAVDKRVSRTSEELTKYLGPDAEPITYEKDKDSSIRNIDTTNTNQQHINSTDPIPVHYLHQINDESWYFINSKTWKQVWEVFY